MIRILPLLPALLILFTVIKVSRVSDAKAQRPQTQAPPVVTARFVDIGELVPGAMIDLRYFGEDNFVGERIDGYEAHRCLGTQELADALRKVQNELQTFGLRIKIFDAYRPHRAVEHFMRWTRDTRDTRTKPIYYPRVQKSRLTEEGYLSRLSAHRRGSAVDLTLVHSVADGTFQELDMGTRFDFLDPLAAPESPEATPQQRANRMLLRKVMEAHGFVPLKSEWWHFELRDEPFPTTHFNFPIR